MIDGLKPNPAMKDSGVPWLGDVPEHWEVRRLKWICRLAYGDALAADIRQVGPVAVYGSNGRVGTHYLANTQAPCLVVGRKGSFGKVNFSSKPVFAIDTTFFVDRRFTKEDVRWLYYLLGWLRLDEVSKDSAVPGLDREEAYQRVAPVPPLPEEAAVVRFLDHADRRIRRYIRGKQKLIKLLEEQKQAIIHRAVTRGLDPNFRLKPSGVEWLGDVPEHWEVRRNGRLFLQRNETGFGELPILEVSLRTGVRVRDLDSPDRKQMMTDRDKYKRARSGDIAYNMMRMWQGAIGLAPVDGLVSPAYVVARPLNGTEPRYFERLFKTAAYMGEVNKYSRGIVKDRNRLYWEDFKRMPSSCPPLSEQVEIADVLDDACREIDAATGRVRREIDLFREYRTRLIADVVTGKLDVREAAARLPDEADESGSLDEAEALADPEEMSAADDLDLEAEEAEA
jgi:type I restriction enzyme S subunit